MTEVNIKNLLEAGVHFGHQTHRWNPKMKKYIFGERNGIYIIDLEITLKCIKRAASFVNQVAKGGQSVLFVGTKKQAKTVLREASERCNMPYVCERWLGGMLTNFETVRRSIGRLDSIDQMEREGGFQYVTKKEVSVLKKEREKLAKNLTGIRNMPVLPGAVFVIDAKKEEIAIREAVKLGIPVIAVLDTNSDPDLVNYPMPGNDDAIRSIKLFCDIMAASISEGRLVYDKKVQEDLAAKKAEEEARAAAIAAEEAKKKEAEEQRKAEAAAKEGEEVAAAAAAEGTAQAGESQGEKTSNE